MIVLRAPGLTRDCEKPADTEIARITGAATGAYSLSSVNKDTGNE